jgi:hypothetical protein
VCGSEPDPSLRGAYSRGSALGAHFRGTDSHGENPDSADDGFQPPARPNRSATEERPDPSQAMPGLRGVTGRDAPVDAFFSATAMAWLPEHRRYWLLTQMSDRSIRFLWLDRRARRGRSARSFRSRTRRRPRFVNPERKLVYADALKPVVFVTSADREANIFRLA